MNIPKYKSISMLVPLLKEHGIRRIVISPGSRMREFILAVEEDPFFETYCVTDERSAAYFAIGMSQESKEPVAITCTSSTATTNYYPGITEAYYQGVPILVLTGDRDPTLLGQQEDQMIDQVGMYDRVVRKSVSLPVIKDASDAWYCNRLINEAILELDHRGRGPVHINVPVPALITWQNEKASDYSEIQVIKRYNIEDLDALSASGLAFEISEKKRILVLAGQGAKEADLEECLSVFFERYCCVIHAEHMANLSPNGRLNLAILSEGLVDAVFDDFLPDLVISFGGTLGISRNLKEGLRKRSLEHWHLCEDGVVMDAYKSLTRVYECKPRSFFEFVNLHAGNGIKNDLVYYQSWLQKYEQIDLQDVMYSSVYAIKRFLEMMPEGCLLHLSILNSVRIAHFFDLPADTRVFANIGTDGIDGCMSTFLGQSVVSERLSFLVVGDLSFFYDMSSIRIKHVRKNARILMVNNHGGNEFYQQPIMPTTDQGLGARHENNAADWVKSVGFAYLSAMDQTQFDQALTRFVEEDFDRPVVFEVFTDQMVDREAVRSSIGSMRPIFDLNAGIKDKVRSVIGESGIRRLKKALGRS